MARATKTATKKSKTATKAATKPTVKPSKLAAKDRVATQQQVLAEATACLNKKYKRQIVQTMDELDTQIPGWVSTQSLALDYVCDPLQCRGLPLGRIADITGDEGTGKSTMGDHLMAEFQRKKHHAYLWDTENARDVVYQEKVGIIRKNAGQIDADSMQEGFEVMIDLLGWHVANDPGRPGIIVWDTPAGTPTANELDDAKTNEQRGPAKLIKGKLRQLNTILKRSKWLLFIVNQTYTGVAPSGHAYKVAYGGSGIPYFASVRLQITHPSKFWRTTGDKELSLPPIGQTCYVKCIKNRVAPPHHSRQIAIHYGQGISNTWDVFNTLEGAGVIEQGGGWYSFASDDLLSLHEKKWQQGHLGLDALIAQHPDAGKLWGTLLENYHTLNKALR